MIDIAVSDKETVLMTLPLAVVLCTPVCEYPEAATTMLLKVGAACR